jgi:hypothetical protein
LLWRGYANAALRARPAPSFQVARGLSAEILSALLLARTGELGAGGFEAAKPQEARRLTVGGAEHRLVAKGMS